MVPKRGSVARVIREGFLGGGPAVRYLRERLGIEKVSVQNPIINGKKN